MNSKTLSYIIKRILLAVLTIIIISAITFFVMHMVPGGPFNREKALDAATIKALEERYNLNKPLFEQYLLYMNDLLHGDFGVSLKNGRDITAIIGESFPISAKLGLMAITIALICGTVFGSMAALMRNKLPDRLIVFFSTLFTAVPSFVLATLLLLVFAIKLGWVPVWSATEVHYTLPVISLAAYPMAYTTRLAKTSMLDALSQDYIRTARAKGVSRGKVIFKHALRNSLIPSSPTPVRRSPISSPAPWSLRPFSPSAASAASSSLPSPTATIRSSWRRPSSSRRSWSWRISYATCSTRSLTRA